MAIWPEPPGSPGTAKPCAICPTSGRVSRTRGISSSDPAQKVMAIRSKRRKLPVNAAAMITPAASTTATSLGTPR